MIKNKKKENTSEFKSTSFRVALLGIIGCLIVIRLVNEFVYPQTQILPGDFFFAVAIAQLFFLWFDEVREKGHILWVQKKKDELNVMKSKFTLITSHELMTPISVIKAYTGLLLEEKLGRLSGDQRHAMDAIERHLTRLEEIRKTLSKLYSGSRLVIERDFKPGFIEELIKLTSNDIIPFVKKRNQALSLEIEENLPPVMMDIKEIRQVLTNLLLNSIRFTPDQGRIIIRAKDIGKDVCVEVEDNGIGIPKDKLQIIFESFYEAGETLQHSSGGIEFKSGGIGLGLTIAKNIIDAHKGKIWAESEVGKYTKLIFTLPK